MLYRFVLSITVAAIVMTMSANLSVAQNEGEAPRQPTRQVSQQPSIKMNAAPPNVGALMRTNNGSLYRAVSNMPNDPRLLKPADVSYFSIAAPKPKELQKHDLLTIIVREESQHKSDAKTDATKTAGIDAKLEQFPSIDLSDFVFKPGITDFTPQLKLSGTRNYANDGAGERKDSFTFRIQAEIVDVKPNGRLVLQARKRITTDDEEQVMILTGECRVQDVTPDNSVLSTQLYDSEVKKLTRGPIRDATKRGWIPKAMDWLNPW